MNSWNKFVRKSRKSDSEHYKNISLSNTLNVIKWIHGISLRTKWYTKCNKWIHGMFENLVINSM